MDIVFWLLKSALTLGAVILVIGALAGLFMIVFSIATGIDRRLHQ
jgi:hypothetical protein